MGIFKVKGSPNFHFAFTHKSYRYRGSTGFAKKQDAQTYYENERRKVRLGESDQDILSLVDAFDRYEEEHAMFLASYPSIKSHVNHLLKNFGNEKPLHLIDQAELARYVADSRIETHRREHWKKAKPITAAAINRRLATFQGMHAMATKVWKIKTQPINFEELRLKERTVVNNTLSRKDPQTLFNAAPEHLQHFIMISLYTGWRKMNVLTLNGKKQIDLDNLTITTIGKGGKLIVSPITEPFEQYIRSHGLAQLDCVCAQVLKKRGIRRPVKNIKTAWKNLFDRTGIKYIRIHDLRHTFGTWLYEQTGDQRLVQEALHHSDIKTSMRYTHTTLGLRRDRMNKATAFEVKQIARVK